MLDYDLEQDQTLISYTEAQQLPESHILSKSVL